MYQEYLAVVDAHDQIIDQRPRGEIHANGLRHRAVHILVFNSRGWLFLQKRSMQKDLNKGLWDTSAAGHVDAGESYDACAVRELAEELGVTAIPDFLFKLDATPELGMEFIQVYSCVSDEPLVLASDEIDAGLWLSLDEISARVAENNIYLTESFRLVWRHFLAQQTLT